MANTNHGVDSFPILEHSTDERIISYGIYVNQSPLYPGYEHVLLKFISFRPSPVIQRDESFAILTNDIRIMIKHMAEQGFAMFSRRPEDPADLLFSFI